jgi:hypothetical protein
MQVRLIDRPTEAAALSTAVGIALGLVSVASDYLLRYPWALVGNVVGTWIVVAFAVGAATGPSTTRAAVCGLLALVVATITYYVATSFAWPSSAIGLLVPGVVAWTVVSVIAGPIAAAAGRAWRSGRLFGRERWWLRPLAVAGVSAVLAAEAGLVALRSTDADVLLGAAAELAVALAIPLVLLRDARNRLTSYALAAIAVVVGLPVMSVSLPIVFRLAGSGHL